jgi:DNA invertase Pin-like site-specific DNA recombinase
MATPEGYSYGRFSTLQQRKGNSKERQAKLSGAWCARNNVHLNATVYFDAGRSGYYGDHRSNPDRHALAQFLQLVEEGKIAPGSYLILESLDRLTREHVRGALMLCLGLIEKGIRLVQLSPSEIIYDKDSDDMQIMLMICELSRGHRESKRKADCSADNWQRKRTAARDGGVMTSELPAWIGCEDGRLFLKPKETAAVRLVFDLAGRGYGATRLTAKLISDGVAPIGQSGKWCRSYIGKLLRDRRTVGECQPCRKVRVRDARTKTERTRRRPEGEPIPNYFPAAVTEEQYATARGGVTQRKGKPGRVSKGPPNLFAGLLHDAGAEGEGWWLQPRVSQGRRYYVLRATRSQRRGGKDASLQYAVLEDAILSKLAEINTADILDGNGAPDETQALGGELADVERSIAVLNDDLDRHGDSAELLARLRRKEARKKELVAALVEARERAAHPLSESWGAAQALLPARATAPDPEDFGVRLRLHLRNIIAEVWLLVVRRGRDRLAAVQLWFHGGGKHRDFLIFHQASRGNGLMHAAAKWRCRSRLFKSKRGELDLRKRADAEALEKELLALDLTEMAPGNKEK